MVYREVIYNIQSISDTLLVYKIYIMTVFFYLFTSPQHSSYFLGDL